MRPRRRVAVAQSAELQSSSPHLICLQNMDRFALRQRVTLMVNRYEVRAGGREGPLLALAEQKRMSFREQVTFFTDERKTQPLFAFRARQVMDVAATYDIMDAYGQPLGWFRKDFGRSLLRSSWVVDVPGQGISGSGTERNQVVGVLRRFVENFNWPVHFDFTTAEGAVFLTIERAWSLRDAYECHLPPDPYGRAWIGAWAPVWLSPATPCFRADDDAAKPDGLALSPLKASGPLNEIGITVICCQRWPSTRVVAQDGSDLRGDRTAAERIGDQIRQVVVA